MVLLPCSGTELCPSPDTWEKKAFLMIFGSGIPWDGQRLHWYQGVLRVGLGNFPQGKTDPDLCLEKPGQELPEMFFPLEWGQKKIRFIS